MIYQVAIRLDCVISTNSHTQEWALRDGMVDPSISCQCCKKSFIPGNIQQKYSTILFENGNHTNQQLFSTWNIVEEWIISQTNWKTRQSVEIRYNFFEYLNFSTQSLR